MKNNRKQSNIIKLVMLAVLVGISLSLVFFAPTSGTSDGGGRVFALQDTSGVTLVSITGPNPSIQLEKTESGSWMLNDSIAAEPSLVKLLLAVLHRNRVRQQVMGNRADSLENALETDGVRVEVKKETETVLAFHAGGDGESKSYFFNAEDGLYEVALPGYSEYVAGIFFLDAFDWSQRTITEANWNTMREIKLTYANPNQTSLHFTYDNGFFSLDGVSELDSARVYDYLSGLSYFYVDQYVGKKRKPAYDSLMSTPPLATLVVTDFRPDQSFHLEIYPPLARDRFVLGRLNGTTWVLLLRQRIPQLLATPQAFDASN